MYTVSVHYATATQFCYWSVEDFRWLGTSRNSPLYRRRTVPHCTTLYRTELFNVHCTLNTVLFTFYIEHRTLYTVHCTLYTVHCTGEYGRAEGRVASTGSWKPSKHCYSNALHFNVRHCITLHFDALHFLSFHTGQSFISRTQVRTVWLSAHYWGLSTCVQHRPAPRELHGQRNSCHSRGSARKTWFFVRLFLFVQFGSASKWTH